MKQPAHHDDLVEKLCELMNRSGAYPDQEYPHFLPAMRKMQALIGGAIRREDARLREKGQVFTPLVEARTVTRYYAKGKGYATKARAYYALARQELIAEKEGCD